MSGLKEFLAPVANGEQLSEDQAERAFEIIMSGAASDAQIGAFLMGLRLRGESVTEITAAARIMRAKAVAVEAPAEAIDIVGTGGDGKGTFNISTAAALVAAGCGVIVAKHGNRAQSSKSGSADVLCALGVNIEADTATIEKAMSEAGIGFMMAPRHHSAMRHVAAARKELGTRTIFNLLGPLANPARVRRQFTGVFARHWIEPMAEVLARLGVERAWVVHGSDGIDEMTTTGVTYVAELDRNSISTFEVCPQDAGLPRACEEDLKGGDAEDNARSMRAILAGERGPLRDIVLLNCAASLVVAERAANLEDGVRQAAAAIDRGKAKAALERLVAVTNAG